MFGEIWDWTKIVQSCVWVKHGIVQNKSFILKKKLKKPITSTHSTNPHPVKHPYLLLLLYFLSLFFSHNSKSPINNFHSQIQQSTPSPSLSLLFSFSFFVTERKFESYPSLSSYLFLSFLSFLCYKNGGKKF